MSQLFGGSNANSRKPGGVARRLGPLALVLLLIVVIGAAPLSQPAVASSIPDTALQAPVAAGILVKVVHGYNDPLPGEPCVIGSSSDHCANQKYGLDLEPQNTSDFRILAPLPGKITWIEGNCMGITTVDNYNLNICHFASEAPGIVLNATVQRAQVLGNRSTSWIHLSLDDRLRDPTSKPPIPFNGAHTLEGVSLDPQADTVRNQYYTRLLTSTNGQVSSLIFFTTICDLLVGCHGPDPTISRANLDPASLPTDIRVKLFNSANQVVLDTRAPISYVAFLKEFEGNLGLSASIIPGTYYAKVKLDNTLERQTGLFVIKANTTNSVPTATLISGDATNDNSLTEDDYRWITIDCYSDALPPKNCDDPVKKRLVDLNYDGKVNGFDYNLFLFSLLNVRHG